MTSTYTATDFATGVPGLSFRSQGYCRRGGGRTILTRLATTGLERCQGRWRSLTTSGYSSNASQRIEIKLIFLNQDYTSGLIRVFPSSHGDHWKLTFQGSRGGTVAGSIGRHGKFLVSGKHGGEQR